MTAELTSAVIRAAAPDDAEQIVAVLNPIIEAGTFTALDTTLTVAEERDYIAAFPERGIFHVAVRRSDGRIVGLQNLDPFATYTHAFDHVGVMGTYVDLSCRRQGIARQLFAATFDAARRKGYEKVFTYVRADNEGALATYLGQGFRVVGTAERHAKIGGRYVDEVLIERFL
jgi:L-amino acid N-acyltransferase YncA